jgi:hypothetical protein
MPCARSGAYGGMRLTSLLVTLTSVIRSAADVPRYHGIHLFCAAVSPSSRSSPIPLHVGVSKSARLTLVSAAQSHACHVGMLA